MTRSRLQRSLKGRALPRDNSLHTFSCLLWKRNMSGDGQDDPRLAKLVSEVRKSIIGTQEESGEILEIAATVETAFRKQWDSPPLEQMELVLRKRMVLEETRQILFFPTEDDMAYYPQIILSAPPDSPNDHPCNKLQPITVPLMYLVHSKKWPLARAFMLADGGLPSLVSLFTADNLYLRSQAIETFSRLTDKEVHMDWMDVSDGNGAVRDQLFQLSGTCDIVKGLLANMKDSYPDGGFTCLKLLAFWLSWVRALYVPDKRLRVSQKLLDSLLEWSNYQDASCKEERELAKVLYDDFNRLPAADFSHLGLQGAKERSVEDMRRDGNTMLKEGRVQQAIDCYTRAIEMAKEGETDSLSLLNRALARLKLDPPDNTGVVQDCDLAIRGGDEENPKAYYRKALGLEGMGNFEAALAAATKAKKLAHGDKGVADVCERIEKQLKDERERARKEKAEREKEERKQKEKDKAAEKLRKAHDVDELD